MNNGINAPGYLSEVLCILLLRIVCDLDFLCADVLNPINEGLLYICRMLRSIGRTKLRDRMAAVDPSA